MKLQSILVADIQVSDRQRREPDPDKLAELAASIDANGLIQPIVVRKDDGEIRLVAGGRRLQALDYVWNLGGRVRCGTQEFAEGHAPCLYLGDIDPLEAFEIELDENIKREDLSWQDRSRAVSQLAELRRLQAQKAGQPPPSLNEIAVEAYPNTPSVSYASTETRQDLILARNLDDPDVAKARTADEGFKILKRKEEARRSVALGESVGRTFSAKDHTLVHGNCLEWLEVASPEQFDVILTDPPYGINAEEFNDSGGKASGGHEYDDSFDNWIALITSFSALSFRVAKPQSHLYVFCDVDNFLHLRSIMGNAGWNCFRTPLVWHNPSSQRAPWPQSGPLRRYQLCLYATRGNRPVLKLQPDVLTYASDQNVGWSAQKPVALFKDLLNRSCRAGDSVLDSFCGSGSIFPAAHELKVRATGIELDPTAYGISVKRLGGLK